MPVGDEDGIEFGLLIENAQTPRPMTSSTTCFASTRSRGALETLSDRESRVLEFASV
jgi:DNA-directed RNA polymerase sigma subunit (sigma70/sigma32)